MPLVCRKRYRPVPKDAEDEGILRSHGVELGLEAGDIVRDAEHLRPQVFHCHLIHVIRLNDESDIDGELENG